MDYEVETGLTTTQGIIDFYNDYYNDKTKWEVLQTHKDISMWNAPKGTPFNQEQPFVMAHHRLHVPSIRKQAEGSSGLMIVAGVMNDLDKRSKWDSGIERMEELHRVDKHLFV
jgi:hypothetical protein